VVRFEKLKERVDGSTALNLKKSHGMEKASLGEGEGYPNYSEGQ